MKSYYFISGLPRSGSTLLSGILKQNPDFHADISSPVNALAKNAIDIITNSENIRESDCDEKIQVGEIVMDERLRMIYQHNKRWYGHYHSNRQHYDHVIKQPNRRVPLESILSF